ncbi:hypothetical protein FBR43_15895 [Sphingomonas baiyangensis]|uniref:Uncharacterized protein n=2 Tax=Sphingomonas baiyangensis TaxID=2572576 RepID=A0A4U1L5Z2_9SPHN|nr:hypothetical protein FBR43_15895 [Sphingomonas baiyangensis]
MYDVADGGRSSPAQPGWACPVMVCKAEPRQGYDALPLLRDQPLEAGERRQLGFVFLAPETAVAAIEKAGRFYLWEGRFIGEATVVANGS